MIIKEKENIIKLLIWIIILISLNGCIGKNNSQKKDKKVVVKYYTQTLAYDNTWYHYKPQSDYYNEASSDFNISKPFQCDEPGDGVSEVYFRNQEAYKNNIPFKSIVYCSKFLIDNITNKESYIKYVTSKRKYDNEGKLVSIFYPKLKQNINFKYTKNIKVISTYYSEPNQTETSKYMYDNKNLLKILKYQNGKQMSFYLFDEKNKNILLEYNLQGKLTGRLEELYEDPSN